MGTVTPIRKEHPSVRSRLVRAIVRWASILAISLPALAGVSAGAPTGTYAQARAAVPSGTPGSIVAASVPGEPGSSCVR